MVAFVSPCGAGESTRRLDTAKGDGAGIAEGSDCFLVKSECDLLSRRQEWNTVAST